MDTCDLKDQLVEKILEMLRSKRALAFEGRQTVQVREIDLDIKALTKMQRISQNLSPAGRVKIGAIVHAGGEGQKGIYYFLVPAAGGFVIEDGNGRSLMCLSVFSPIGRAIVLRKMGEQAEFELEGTTRTLTILAVE